MRSGSSPRSVARFALALAFGVGACVSPGSESEAPGFSAELVEQSCARAQAELSPLLVGVPLPQRNALDTVLGRGDSLIMVRYTGCELEVLRECSAAGSYAWSPAPPQPERRALYSVEQLFAELPLGALKLVPLMQHYESLHLTMTSVGRYRAEGAGAEGARAPSGARCEEATHVVAGIVVGAYALSSRLSVSVDVDVQDRAHDVDVEGSSRHQEDYFSNEGSPATCHEGESEGAAGPTRDCAAFVGLELRPLAP